MLFHDIRAVADSTPWVDAVQNKAWRIERVMFGGELLNARLQRFFFDPAHIEPMDHIVTGVHLSFIAVSLIAGIVVSWRNWQRTLTFLVAKTVTFVVGFLIIFAIPTTPPWLTPDSALSNPADASSRVYRVTTIVLGQGNDYSLGDDKNAIAAMPSIHMATTFLVLLLLWGYGRTWRVVGMIYVGAMAFALVYLGEHYVIDEIAGILLALESWRLAYAWQERGQPDFVDRFKSMASTVRQGPGPGQPQIESSSYSKR